MTTRFIAPIKFPLHELGVTGKPAHPAPVPTPEQLERLKTWVAALRSGKYTQGRYFLKQGKTHCCLGVACDVYAQANKKDVDDLLGDELHSDTTEIPQEVADYFGLANCPPSSLPNNLCTYDAMMTHTIYTAVLSKLNDGLGYTFEQIAKVIEKQLINMEWNDGNTVDAEAAEKIIQSIATIV